MQVNLFENQCNRSNIGHELNYVSKSEFNSEILKEINDLKGKIKTIKDLTSHINSKFGCDFEDYQINYSVEKLLKENFGTTDEDAFNFIQLAKTDVEKNGGFFEVEASEDNRLIKVLYISGVMLKYAKKFLDVVIVGSTYKRNRFNPPLVNIVGINNLGFTIFFAFSFKLFFPFQELLIVVGISKKIWYVICQISLKKTKNFIKKPFLFLLSQMK